MTATASFIELFNNDTLETREIAIRGDVWENKALMDRLYLFMKARPHLQICNISMYAQPSFAQSLHYHRTGEVI